MPKQSMHLLFASFLAIMLVSVPVFGQSPGLYNDDRMAEAVSLLFRYMEGSFGALIMAVAGIMGIVNAAMGNYKACLSLLVVAIGTFILKSFIATFFNAGSIPGFN